MTFREKLLAHLGHQVVIATYGEEGDGRANDVTVECVTCHEIIISTEPDEEGGQA